MCEVDLEDLDERLAAVRRCLEPFRLPMGADGGGVEAIAVGGDGIVDLRFGGTCTFCPSVRLTTAAIEAELRRALPWARGVRTSV